MKLNWTRIILGAIAYLAIGLIMNTVSSLLTMDYYKDPNYFAVWSRVMMPAEGAPPANFYYYSISFSFIVGLIYSYIYSRVKGMLKGTAINKGLRYGFVLFLMAGIPFFFSLYLLINLPLSLLIYWLVIDGLLAYLLGGIAIAWLNK
jgi:hypothetical protein